MTKVLLKQNISKLGIIGDVVDVKSGYARNYLLPQQLAIEPTDANIRAIEASKQAYLEQLARDRAEIEARAKLIDGKEITISARANAEGHLYGSIGPAQISAAMLADGMHVDEKDIVLDTHIRQLDKYDVRVKFAHEVTATVGVWVVPIHEDGDESARVADEEPPEAGEDDDYSYAADEYISPRRADSYRTKTARTTE